MQNHLNTYGSAPTLSRIGLVKVADEFAKELYWQAPMVASAAITRSVNMLKAGNVTDSGGWAGARNLEKRRQRGVDGSRTYKRRLGGDNAVWGNANIARHSDALPRYGSTQVVQGERSLLSRRGDSKVRCCFRCGWFSFRELLH